VLVVAPEVDAARAEEALEEVHAGLEVCL